MKNIQIIDGADNATYSIFQATDDEFANGLDMSEKRSKSRRDDIDILPLRRIAL
jgi:hypothetical protein